MAIWDCIIVEKDFFIYSVGILSNNIIKRLSKEIRKLRVIV